MTLPELAEYVDRLIHMAYPDAAAMLHVFARDQFIDALPDEDMCLRVRQNHPSNLMEAQQCALDLESYQLASRHHYGRGAGSAKRCIWSRRRDQSSSSHSSYM